VQTRIHTAFSQLVDALTDEIVERLQLPQTDEGNLLSTSDLAAKQGVSVGTVEKWRAQGCPALRLSARAYRYDLKEVRAWLTSRNQ
jgi:hypothetical protein